jgi:hypothetical protein
MEHIGFPSIRQYTDVVRYVGERMQYAGKDDNGNDTYHPYTVPRPKLMFRGTPKLHGTNAAVVLNVATGELSYQSRDRVVTLDDDLFDFMNYMVSKSDQMRQIANAVLDQQTNDPEYIAIYGEWCGGEIQKGQIALKQLPKMFCIFAVKVVKGKNKDGSHAGHWFDIEKIKDLDFPEDRIYNTLRFGQWNFEIDFERPKIFQNDLADITTAVEALCPAAKYFGIEGIGEGVVWTCQAEGWDPYQFSFKVVGQQHAKTKRKELAPVDLEAVKALEDFVAATVTEARLQQALHVLQREMQKPLAITSQGDFARWVYNDIIKEEEPLMTASQLDPKKLGAPISTKARYWFIEHLKAQGLV